MIQGASKTGGWRTKRHVAETLTAERDLIEHALEADEIAQHYSAVEGRGLCKGAALQHGYGARDHGRGSAHATTGLLADGELAKSDFAVYNEKVESAGWPFDANVVVHAVGENGVNFILAVVKIGE
ncbi:hypothetical protein MPH_13902 [Macrophomina phaseolina MS6]|uniref:Uncharacterized protein n=1 Tax=Macrophomina phaseolina (strain MS6) TaxID=1126212 RepID=K2RG94_MACPH|nr:hypothetical protein MPH_13902 [Macrophomina phaseolina MS6]